MFFTRRRRENNWMRHSVFRRKNVHVDDLLQGSKYIRVYDECVHVCICICMHMYMQMCLYIYIHMHMFI